MLSEAFSDARLNLDSLDKDIKAAQAKVRKFAEQAEQALKLNVDVDTADAERKLDRLAASAAQVKARIEADAATLRIELDADPERAAALGREARQAVETGFGDRPLDLNVDLDFEAATFYGRVARASIEEGFGTDPIVADVTADFDAALFAGRVARDSLEAGAGVTPIQLEVDVDLGSLVTARAEMDAITRFDEDIRLNLNTKSFDASYAKVLAKLEALTRKQWTVDLDSNADVIVDLIEEVIAAAREADQLKVGITFDTEGADAARRAADEARDRFEADPPVIRPDIDLPDADEFNVPAPIVPEADTSRFERSLADVSARLDGIRRDAANLTFDTDGGSDAVADAAVLRRRIRKLLDGIGRIAFQAQDDEQVLAVLARLEAQARKLDAATVRLGVKVDGDTIATGKLIALDRVADDVDRDIEFKVGFSGRLNEAVLRRTAERVARISARVQADIDASTAAESARDRAAAAREEGDQAFRDAISAEQKLAAEILRIRRRLKRSRFDLNARAALREKKQALKAAQEETAIIRRAANERVKTLTDAEVEVSRVRRRLGGSTRVERITLRTEGIAKTLAEFALVQREKAGLDGPVKIGVDSRGFARRFLSGVAPVNAFLDRLKDRGQGGFDIDTSGLRRAADALKDVDLLLFSENLRVGFTKAYRDIGDTATGTARRVRKAFEGKDLLDITEAVRERSTKAYRDIGDAAEDAGRRVRRSFADGGSFRLRFDDARDELDGLVDKARETVKKLRNTFRQGGQGGFDLRSIRRGFAGLWRNVTTDATKAFATIRRSVSKITGGFREVAIRTRVLGVRGVLADLAKIVAAKVIAGRDINIGANVRGSFVGRGAARIVSGLAGFAASAVQGLGSIAAQGASLFSKLGSGVANLFSQASGAVSDFVAQASKQVQSLASSLSAASGPIGAAASAFAATLLPTLIIGGIVALAGPVITAIGGLIGAAVAFLAASAFAGLAAVGLPIAAILFDPAAVEEIKSTFVGLKDLLVESFAGTTDLIVNQIIPAFAGLAAAVIPLAAQVADSFIVPITNSVINLVDALLPVITQVTGPMAEGIASVLDTLARFAPLFGDITIAVGPGLTDAFNAILEVSLTIAGIFAGQIGQGFQGFANLLRDLTPQLVQAGNSVLPILTFVGDLIRLIVRSGTLFENSYGPLGDVFERLSGALPQLEPVFAAIASYAVGLVESFVEFLPVITTVIRVFITLQGVIFIIRGVLEKLVGYIARAFGIVVQQIANGIAEIAEFILGLLDKLPSFVADRIPGFDGLRDGLKSVAEGSRDFGKGAEEATNRATSLGDAALRSGSSMVELSVGLGATAEASEETTNRIAELNGQLRTGEVGISDYLSEMADTVPIAAAAQTALTNFEQKLDDGSIGGTKLADTLSNLNSGIGDLSSFLTEENTSISQAFDERAKSVTAELDKLAALLAVKQSGIAGSFEVAELLQGLSPAEVDKFFDEVGPVTGAGFARVAQEAAQAAAAGGTIIANAVADTNRQIELESAKLGVAVFASDKGLGALSTFIETQVDAADIPRVFSELASATDEELQAFNNALERGQAQARELAVQEAQRQAEIAAEGAARAATAAAERARTAWEATWGEGGLLAPGSLLNPGGILNAPPAPGADNDAGAAGAAFAESFGLGFEGEFASVKTDVIGAAINSLKLEGVDTSSFQATGAQLAAAIITGFNLTLNGGLGAGGIFGPVGIGAPGGAVPVLALAQSITSNTGPFLEAGQTIAGAFIVGVVAGLSLQDGGIANTVNALAGSLDDNVDAYSTAGTTVGQAFVRGLTGAIGGGGGAGSLLGPVGAAFSPAALAASSVAVTIGATTGPFTIAGETLGGALVAGITGGADVAIGGVGGSLAVYAGRVGGQEAPWRAAGLRLGRALIESIRRNVLAGFAVVAASARTVAGQIGIEPWLTRGRTLGQALAAGIAAGVLAAATIARAAATAVAGSFDPGPYIARGLVLGRALAAGIAAGIADGGGAVASALRSVVTGGNASEAAFQGGVTTGRSIVNGLTVGINLGSGAVYAAAARVANTVATIMRAALQTRSPSRVTAAIGRDVVRGFAVGLADSTEVEVAARQMASVVVSAAETALAATDRPYRETGERLGSAVGAGVRDGFANSLSGGFDLIGSAVDPNRIGRQMVEAMRRAGLTVDFKSDGFWYVNNQRVSTGAVQEDRTARIFTPDRALIARIVNAVAPVIGTGVSAALAPTAASRAAQAQQVYNQTSTSRETAVDQSDRSVVFSPVIQTNDPYALYRKFEEIAKRRP